MQIEDWNELLEKYQEGRAAAQEVEDAATNTLDIYFNRYPNNLDVDDCDQAGLKAGIAEIKVDLVAWDVDERKFKATVNFAYPVRSGPPMGAATRYVEQDRKTGRITVMRSRR